MMLIKAGNFEVSISEVYEGDVAIYSRTGNFCKLSSCKRSKKLRKVKRLFKTWLNSNDTFTFSHMTKDRTDQLISLLKLKK